MKRKWDNRKNITTDIAYIAGIMDGEGCVRIKKSNPTGNSYYITVQITNSDKDILLFIQKRFGGKIYHQERTKNKTIYQYAIYCGEAIAFLKTIENFSITKKKQIEMARLFHMQYDEMKPRTRQWFYNEMKRLKKFEQILEQK